MYLMLYFFYFLLYKQENSSGIVKILDLFILMDLHVLECAKHDLTIFENVCLSLCDTDFINYTDILFTNRHINICYTDILIQKHIKKK